MSKDDLGLAGFILSLIVAAWNLLKFWQEGGRVKVTLKPGVLNEHALHTMNSFSPKRDPGKFERRGLRFNVEVAVIQLENCGRTPVTIRGVGLDLGRTRWWKFGRRTMSFPFLKFNDSETNEKVRLEPYDSVEYLINANHALWAMRKELPSAIKIRAMVQVAGKRAVRSSWRKRWRIAKGTPPRLWLDEPFDLAREVYRYLYKSVPEADSIVRLMLPEIAMKIADWVEAGNEVTQAELQKLIDGSTDSWSGDERLATALWSFNLVREFNEPTGGPFDASSFKQRRLARAAAANSNSAVVSSPDGDSDVAGQVATAEAGGRPGSGRLA